MIMTGPKLTADHLAEIKRTDEERTPGKWDYYLGNFGDYLLTANGRVIGTIDPFGDTGKGEAVNAFFISHATEYMPQLVAEVERLTGENSQLRAQEVTPSEAIFAFAAWLTQRDEEVTLSAHNEAGRVAELCGEYSKAQGWEEPRDGIWPGNIKPMKNKRTKRGK